MALSRTTLLNAIFGVVNRRVPWTSMPRLLGLINVYATSLRMREKNLHDTEELAAAEPDGLDHSERTADGSFNDLRYPTMGQAGRRFARNVSLQYAYPETGTRLLSPNVRTISRRLLTREEFIPAKSLNVLAAAWIQFQVHDWFNHSSDEKNSWEIPLEKGDPWPTEVLKIQKSLPDAVRQPGDEKRPPTFINNSAHWWDGSQIYGSSAEKLAQLRLGEDGKLTIGEDGLLPLDPKTQMELTGFNQSWWVGLDLLHTLFVREHNAICERLRQRFPTWTDDQLFARARLINVALMAKIHTVDWTPRIVAHPAIQLGMRADWWGLAGERLYRRFGRLAGSEVVSGIPGSHTDHGSGVYAMTEEFVAVYRMHPLMPDEFSFRRTSDNVEVQKNALLEVLFERARERLEEVSPQDVAYSLGTSNPGAIRLHNFPKTLQSIQPPDSPLLDMAAIDIMRDRERGVPRYNRFRQLLYKPPVKTFEEMTDDPVWARELREVYEGDVDRVDLMVGMYAEPLPFGFGFSETAFRLFSLMAPRRLKSDRFFTNDFRAEVYTEVGMKWISDNNMTTLLARHFPGLQPMLAKAPNPFAQWQPAK